MDSSDNGRELLEIVRSHLIFHAFSKKLESASFAIVKYS